MLQGLATTLALLGMFATQIVTPREASEKRFVQEMTLIQQGMALSAPAAVRLEDLLKTDPGDLETRLQLLGYYAEPAEMSKPARELRNGHVIWLVQHAPDSPAAGTPYTQIDPVNSPEAFANAKKLWLAEVDKPSTNSAVLANAAQFFSLSDPEQSGKILRILIQREPENPEWQMRMGFVEMGRYAMAIDNPKPSIAASGMRYFEKGYELETQEMTRFYVLTELVPAAVEAEEWEKVKKYAEDLLTRADRYKSDWNFGNAIHQANIALGKLAFHEKDIEKAKTFLIAAGRTPGSPQLNTVGPDLALAKKLLDAGERQAVIQYFEACMLFWRSGAGLLRGWIDDLKSSRNPQIT